jgi:hypothetical protein
VAVEAQAQIGVGAEARAHIVARGVVVLRQHHHPRVRARFALHLEYQFPEIPGVAQTLLETRHQFAVERVAGAKCAQRQEQRGIQPRAGDPGLGKGVTRPGVQFEAHLGFEAQEIDAQLRLQIARLEEAEVAAGLQQVVAEIVVARVRQGFADGKRRIVNQFGDGRDGVRGLPHPYVGGEV